ncbi:Holliday junction resolvase RecU [Lysinibacillus sp. KU-BSD001]|uniref:Holliday junction resolvase RecU n=1 Tax=Lysinibacillus sp. KU-BSD001 TaxID=3141328 RepID=UPI0036E96A7B
MIYQSEQQARQGVKSHTHAHRGKFLERVIDIANTKYRNAGLADIRKIPTPVQIKHDTGREVIGRKEKAEWVDYAGVCNGRAVVFDAKETRGKNFPLKNLHDHQYELLKSWYQKGAISFLLVYFKELDKYYRLPFKPLCAAWEEAKNGGAKSIPIATFEAEACEVKSMDGYTLHYLLPYL